MLKANVAAPPPISSWLTLNPPLLRLKVGTPPAPAAAPERPSCLLLELYVKTESPPNAPLLLNCTESKNPPGVAVALTLDKPPPSPVITPLLPIVTVVPGPAELNATVPFAYML